MDEHILSGVVVLGLRANARAYPPPLRSTHKTTFFTHNPCVALQTPILFICLDIGTHVPRDMVSASQATCADHAPARVLHAKIFATPTTACVARLTVSRAITDTSTRSSMATAAVRVRWPIRRSSSTAPPVSSRCCSSWLPYTSYTTNHTARKTSARFSSGAVPSPRVLFPRNVYTFGLFIQGRIEQCTRALVYTCGLSMHQEGL